MAQVPHDELRAQGAEPDHWHVEHERKEHRHQVRMLQRRPDPVRMADRDDRRPNGDADQSRRQAAGPEASWSGRGGLGRRL